MVFTDDEDETRTYSVKEIKERLAREKAKTASELDDRFKNLEQCIKALSDKIPLVDLSATSFGKPLAPGDEGFAAPAQTSGASKPPESYQQYPFTYPKSNPLMPHINHSGPSPHFDGTHFSYWKTSMESHLRSCSEELWDVVVHGFNPNDPNNLTPREYYDRQLNATARDKIRSAVHRALHDQVSDLDSAKELWDRIVILQEGTSLIQKSKYESAKSEMNLFMIKDGESLSDAYARLDALRVKIKGLGCDKFQDGFDVNDETIKSKIVSIIVSDDKKNGPQLATS